MTRRGLGRPFWVVFAAGAISFLGDGITFGALPLLACAVIAGWLAHQTNIRTPYVALGLLQLLATLIFAPYIRTQLKAVQPT